MWLAADRGREEVSRVGTGAEDVVDVTAAAV